METICIKTRYLSYEISHNGQNLRFSSIHPESNRILSGPCAALIREDHTELPAVGAMLDKNILTITFSDATTASILVEEHEAYITFTLKSVSCEDFLAIAFVNIEVDDQPNDFFATLIGMTLSTHMQEHPGDNRLLCAKAYPHIGLFSTPRSPYPAKAAIVGAPKSLLHDIERLVLDEIPEGELPKSHKGGPYANLAAKDAQGAYSIFMETVTLDNIDDALSEMRRFGITQVNLHHFGHYVQGDFRCAEKHFPGGVADFKAVIDRFHEENILVGLHTYSFFLVPESSYVSPVPHPDLDTLREFTLAAPLDKSEITIKVCESTDGMSADVGYLLVNSPYLWIDDELIRFRQVNGKCFDLCERGAYGTIPATHAAGARVRQLKQYFFLPLARAGSTLFYEIARNTALFYNECGADLFYLDALDGSFILDGENYVWYHAMDFIREMFRYLERDPLFDCCYNPQYTGSWFVRSRYGAIDTSLCAHRQYIDAHVKYNEETALRMGITPELGWVDLYPREEGENTIWQNEPLFAEDLEYLCAKAFSTQASIAILESFRRFADQPRSELYAQILQKYSAFRQIHTPSAETQAYLKMPGNTAYLDAGTLYRAQYSHAFIERAGDGFCIENPFDLQTPSFRIEPLCAAGDYDSPDGVMLCDIPEHIPITDKSLRFDIPVNSKGNRGLGVWCRGDGSGAIICIKLCNFAANKQKSGEHFIRVSFTGWRYFAFYENQNGGLPCEEWPRTDVKYNTYNELQGFYGHYRVNLDYDSIDGVDICVRGSGNVFLKPLRLVPHRKPIWHNPTLTLEDGAITFDTSLQADSVLHFNGRDCIITDSVGNILERPTWVGAPLIPPGRTNICMTHCGKNELVRAKVTVSLRGGKLQ